MFASDNIPSTERKTEEKRPASADVVIVGAGPIGLAHAWGIKKLNPSLKVVVLEKYEEYQRNHTLVMQHQQLKKLMAATGAERDPDLCDLLAQLKKDPHIRTSELEQKFKNLAKKNGVEIIIQTVEEKKIDKQLYEYEKTPCLIIGADGTHSTVNQVLFPEGNQIKYEFDYVLQLRYEIQGDHYAKPINNVTFLQDMANQGMIGNEYVGRFADGKTPVTMQMMISKKDFEYLKDHATSKKPIKPFITGDADVPPKISKFISRYLAHKIKDCCEDKLTINKNSKVSISVNEAPATHAKHVVVQKNGISTILVGDAGLGLSYFKGLNAGLESTAKLFTFLASIIKKGMRDKKKLSRALQKYEAWFLKDFAPKKVKEVAQYSTWRIRSLMRVMKLTSTIKNSSQEEHKQDLKYLIAYYFHQQGKNSSDHPIDWNPFPHREYDPEILLGQFDYIPIKYSVTKIKKLFIDYLKPYKSFSHFSQDLKQPLVGFVNFMSGLVKITVGTIDQDKERFNDGAISLLRGVLELATTPLAWFVKPITRTVVTVIKGQPKIENNVGIKRLVNQGRAYLADEKESKEMPAEKVRMIKHICFDLTRKFEKAMSRNQPTNIDELMEIEEFNKVRESLNRSQFVKYFSLFDEKERNVHGLAISDGHREHNKIMHTR